MIFRGQASAGWDLIPTIDRIASFVSAEERQELLEILIEEFRREAAGLEIDNLRLVETKQWEFLARHHGLPTTILDWTASPYIAAFFAFSGGTNCEDENVAVWVLDKDAFAKNPKVSLDLLDDFDTFTINKRSVHQRSQFLRIGLLPTDAKGVLDDYLFRYEIPQDEAEAALSDLDQMTITERTLFADLDSASRTATWRIMQGRKENSNDA